MIFWTVSDFQLWNKSYHDYITSISGALKDFDKVEKKAPSEGESSKQSESTAAALADLPPGWTDEFLKFVH